MHFAVVGMAIRAKGAHDPHQLRQVLARGANMVGDFPATRQRDALPFFDDVRRYPPFGNPARVRFGQGAFLEDVDSFDSRFFRIAPSEAQLMDPCQRLFLECAMACAEVAGYPGDALRGTETGVFVGHMPDFRPFNYRDLIFKGVAEWDQIVAPNLISVIPSRLSYFLDLRGPSICVDTSCSSALLAVHLACRHIEAGECRQAIAGAVKLNLAPFSELPRLAIESPRYRSRVFDANADGIGLGEGVGAVMIKSLDDALRDNDFIWCVIRGSWANQDGRSGGIARPNGQAQERLLLRAWQEADVTGADIGYIEAHGTGTRVGDPIELTSIANALRASTSRKQFCGVGSSKANYGHWYEAAGILSFIKCALSVHYGELYPQIGIEELVLGPDLLDTGLFIPLDHCAWPSSPGRRRIAGVSAFGVSGTNVHVVVEEFRAERQGIPSDLASGSWIFFASAENQDALTRDLAALESFLKSDHQFSISDICYTSSTLPARGGCRIAIEVQSLDDLVYNIHRQIDYLKMGFAPLSVGNAHGPKDSVSSFLAGQDRADLSSYYPPSSRKVPLPARPFRRERHWVTFDDSNFRRVSRDEPLHFELRWEALDPLQSSEMNGGLGSTLLCLGAQGCERVQAIASELRKRGAAVDVFDAACPGPALSAALAVADTVIHMGSLAEEEAASPQDLERALERGVFSLFHVLSMLHARPSRTPVTLYILTNQAMSVSDSERVLIPENSAIIGLGRVIEREATTVRCSALDIERESTPPEIIDALSRASDSYLRALRSGREYVQRFHPIELPDKVPCEDGLGIRDSGFYLITGGTGGLGLAFAEFLSQQGASRVVLASRSGRVAKNNEGTFERIKKSGTLVEIVPLDMGCVNDVCATIADLRARHGRLNGIVHGAGVPGTHLLVQNSLEEFRKVSDPKIFGGFAIAKAAKVQPLDFVLLYSSVATLFPAVGQGDYCAANTYLDVLAQNLRRSGVPALAVNWVAWADTGMAFDVGANIDTTFKALGTSEALQAQEKAFSSGLVNCLIGRINQSPGNLGILQSYRIPLSQSVMSLADSLAVPSGPGVSCPRSVRATPAGRSSGIYSELETALAKVWGDTMGYDEVNVTADIYDLGADSLVIAKIVARSKTDLELACDIADVVSAGNIETLAAWFQGQGVVYPMAATNA